jgi:integrase
MASVYRRCRKCRSESILPQGSRACQVHGKGPVAWTGVVEVGTTTQRKRRGIGYHATKAEAEAVAAELTKKQAQGVLAQRTDMLVTEWMIEWLDGPAKLKVRPTTHRSYAFQVETVNRHLGDVKLQKLTLGRVQSFYAHLADEKSHGLAVRTIRNYHALLRRALQVALKQGLVDRNVLADDEAFQMRLPEIEHETWTPGQLSEYLAAAMTHRLGSALWLAVFTGARRGEVTGVQWRDIDLSAGEWSVSRARLITGMGEPKSKAGRRIIGLDDGTVEVLSQWRSQQRQELLAVGINLNQYQDLAVFSTPGAGSCVHPDTISKLHARAVSQAGLPWMKLHGLRHMHGSLLVSAGESLKAVSTRLGHSSAAFTLSVYVRDLPGERRQMATRFAEIMSEAASQ